MSPKKKTKEIKYQEALDELESIVAEVENDTMDVDILSERISRALELINYCRSKLKDTENMIQKAFEGEEEED
ncbi:exodeoxyribonuclease VII small subunit [Porifericola rhodea]|uniref:exodeoxyribonuclease VII small subunit n=1 Tax=Porifericola rhodea TaxID=930972 RepID=UPI0026659B09|nr:exodeoxyribonuclease VII small subunit [Porifericola rhodea]WKN30972.1 exodeoxyribonuclease VII small subunit [Porifericola rhodea]